MPMPTPDQAAKNWSTGMANSSAKMTAGINAVTDNPADKAIAAIPRMLQGIQAAVADGRVERGLRSVTLAGWKSNMLNKGVPRVSAGATAALPKVQAFMQQFLPFLAAGVAALPARGDYSQNKSRAIAMMDYNHGFKKS